jgi:hypothetical protein
MRIWKQRARRGWRDKCRNNDGFSKYAVIFKYQISRQSSRLASGASVLSLFECGSRGYEVKYNPITFARCGEKLRNWECKSCPEIT